MTQPNELMQGASLADLGLDQQLLARLEFAAGLLDTLNVWMNVHDPDLRMVLWNRTAERITGYQAKDVLGHDRVWEWCYPEGSYRRPIEERAHTIVDEDYRESDYENELRCKDGSIRSIRWFASPLYDSEGETAGALVIGHDVSDLREHQHALERAHDEKAALFAVASIAAEEVEMEDILKRCAHQVRELFSSRAVMIHLCEDHLETSETPKSLKLRSSSGLDASNRSRFAHWRVGDSMPGDAVTAPIRASRGQLGQITLLHDGLKAAVDSPLPLSSVAHQIGVAVENALLREKAQRLAVLEERSRLARELHDSVTQSVYSMQLFAEAGRRAIRSGQPERADSSLRQIADASADALRELRLLVFELRPTILERGGLEAALRERLGSVERRSGLEAELDFAAPNELNPALEQDVYRIVLEGLNNCLKHAAATRVAVEIATSDRRLLLRLRDNGVGFDLEKSEGGGGVGIGSMNERAARHGGTLDIQTAPGRGTELQVSFPLPAAGEPHV